MKDLDLYKAHGSDGYLLYILYECQDRTLMLKNLLGEGPVLREWPRANVSILRRGNRKNAPYYRPVSLRSMVYKQQRKIIRRKIDEYLQRRDTLSGRRHRFREKMSSNINLID